MVEAARKRTVPPHPSGDAQPPINRSSDDLRADVVVAGFGSPHGDDQAGWQVITLLARKCTLPARFVKIAEGTQLIDELQQCRRLLVVDACRGGLRIGTVTRFDWSDPRLRKYHNHSTHGVGLCNALELAERLGRIPPIVEIFGIEIGSYRPLDEISADVRQAVAELVSIISAELCETVHA